MKRFDVGPRHGAAIHFAMATLPLAPGHVLSYCGRLMSEAETVKTAELTACVTCRDGLFGVGLRSGLAMHPYPPSQLPTSIAGRMELISEWLYGIPVVTVCPCGCGLETDTGRREPLITQEDARRLMDAASSDGGT